MKINAAHELEEATGRVPRVDGRPTFRMDGDDIPFHEGQSILAAALAAGHYIPYLCYHPEFEPHGSCKVCTVRVNGRTQASCTQPAREGDVVEANVEELSALRRGLVQFLFVEGNHFCPSCEASGNCTLQAVGYEVGLTTAQFNPLFPVRPVDASHPEVLLDFNRCILCELCVRASALVDEKHVFALSGRGITKHLVVNAESGRLADTALGVNDKAMSVCPVGAILRKRRGFEKPIGQRKYDAHPIGELATGHPGVPDGGVHNDRADALLGEVTTVGPTAALQDGSTSQREEI